MKTRWKLTTISVLCAALLCPLHSKPLPPGAKVTRIVVIKSQRILQLWSGEQLVKTYKVSLGSVAVGRKEKQGDHRTPEGEYVISGRNAKSRFHMALRVSYPNAEDKQRASRLGVSPGGDIMIHGLPNGYGWIGRGHLATDWTDGCIAVTNEQIEEIWRLVPDGTRLQITP